MKTIFFSLAIVLAVGACEEAKPSDSKPEDKPNPNWAEGPVGNWAKAMHTDLRGSRCMYHSDYAICDVAYPNDSLDQLKCYKGKDDDTPRGCFRVELMKVSE